MVAFDILKQQLLPLSSMPLALNVHVRDAESSALNEGHPFHSLC